MAEAFELAIFGHKIDDQEIRGDCRYKASKVKKPFYKQIQELLNMLRLVWTSNAVTNAGKDYRPVFKLDMKNANSKELFDVVTTQVNQFTAAHDNHLHASLGSMFSNSILYSFLSSKITQGDQNASMNTFSKIVSSAQNVVSAEVPVILQRIANRIPQEVNFLQMSDEEAIQYMKISSDRAAREFRTFLLDYGHRGTKEFDVYADKWEDDPTMLVQSLKSTLSSRIFFLFIIQTNRYSV